MYAQLVLLADKKECQPQNSMVFSVAILLIFTSIIIVVGFVVVVSRYDVLDIVH